MILRKEISNKGKAGTAGMVQTSYLFSSKTILLLVRINHVSERLQGFFWNNLPKKLISFQTSFRVSFFT